MSDKLIFVSCGQLTAEEKRLGRRVQEAIDSQEGFSAYFADSVQSLATLGNHIFDALRRCAGAVAVLHSRGVDGRSSMWINQELAVLAYRQFFEATEIPILVFKDASVRLEGAMTAFIVNARPLANDEAVVADILHWLSGDAIAARSDDHAVFATKWAVLAPEDRLILRAVIDEGGQGVKESSIRRRLVDAYGVEKNAASTSLRTRRAALSQANLIQLRHNINDGDEISLHPSWQWYVRHEVRKP